MIDEIEVKGFKKFRWHNGFKLKSLKKVNVLVGPNGSGKSSFIEMLCLLLPQMTYHRTVEVPLHSQPRKNFYSLFEGNAQLNIRLSNHNYRLSLEFDSNNYNVWNITSDPGDGTLKFNVHYFGDAWDGIDTAPFSSFQSFSHSKDHTAIDLNDYIPLFDSNGASIGDISTTHSEHGPIVQQKNNRSINERFFANGVHVSASITRAMTFNEQDGPLRITLLDEVDNGLFPKMRKKIIDEITSKVQQAKSASQVFMATHNIEVVSAALENPECNVYYFSPNGIPMTIKDGKLTETTESYGIDSLSSAVLISSMLGISPKDIGLPEVPVLVEELTKKTLLEAYLNREEIKIYYKNVDIIPAGEGDGLLGRNIENLAQLSKYFSFSRSWKSSYIIFTDWNSDFFDSEGIAVGSPKNSGDNAKQKIKVAQDQLKERFILTKNGDDFVSRIENVYPLRLWNDYKKDQNISYEISIWTNKASNKEKNELAHFIGNRITMEEFSNCFHELHQLISLDC